MAASNTTGKKPGGTASTPKKKVLVRGYAYSEKTVPAKPGSIATKPTPERTVKTFANATEKARYEAAMKAEKAKAMAKVEKQFGKVGSITSAPGKPSKPATTMFKGRKVTQLPKKIK